MYALYALPEEDESDEETDENSSGDDHCNDHPQHAGTCTTLAATIRSWKHTNIRRV